MGQLKTERWTPTVMLPLLADPMFPPPNFFLVFARIIYFAVLNMMLLVGNL